MQTFLPYPDFTASAMTLDNRRLGKQRVETLQIMTALLTGRGWVHHPATKMWGGYEWALLKYQEAVCVEWLRRGFSDTCLDKTIQLYLNHFEEGQDGPLPPWLGDSEFHLSHQSNLVRKDERFYGIQFRGVPDDLPYVWPV